MLNPNAGINNGFGAIYRPRGTRTNKACLIVLFLYISFNYFLAKRYEFLSRPWYFYEFAFGVSILVRVMGEVIRRLCLFAEEHRHIDSRYNGSWKKAFHALFEFKYNKLLGAVSVIAAVMVSHVFLNETERVSFTPHGAYFWFALNIVFIPVFVHLVGLNEPSKVEYLQINEEQNKNIADGLAWSFYFGYLKLVLPELESQINLTEGFRNRIERQKVFIIIPKNCQVDDIISDPRNLVNDVGKLDSLNINRGGIRERSYRHTVYRIVDEISREEHYCVMEYATPLKVLHEMSNDPNAGLSREERDYQVVSFYRKVKEILDRDESCRGKYELIAVSGENDEIGRIMINALTNPAIEMR